MAYGNSGGGRKRRSGGHKGNRVKTVYNPRSGKSSNYIASKPGVEPDTKHDPQHGHIDLNESGDTTFRRDGGNPRRK